MTEAGSRNALVQVLTTDQQDALPLGVRQGCEHPSSIDSEEHAACYAHR